MELGKRIVEVLKQKQYQPVPVENQVVILYAVINGYLDEIEVEQVARFEKAFQEYLNAHGRDLLVQVRTKKELDKPTEEKLKKILDRFKKLHS